MDYERQYIDPPSEWFDGPEYLEIHRCDACGEKESAFLTIHFDEKYNENRCNDCIESTCTQQDLGLNDYRFQQYIDKILKQPPRCK